MALGGAAALGTLSTEPDRALKVTIQLWGLATLLVVYVLGTVAADRSTALAAAALLGAAPEFWNLCTLFLSEVPFLAGFSGAMLALHCALHRDARWIYVSAAFTALALLTRYTAVLAGVLAPLVVAVAWSTRDRSDRTTVTARHLGGAVILGFVLMAPWLLRQWWVFGDPLVGFRIASGQLQTYMPTVSMPWDFYLATLPRALTWPTVALCATGALWGLRRRDPFTLTCLAIATGLLAWFSAYRYKETRLAVGALPFLSLVAAMGLTRGVPELIRGPAQGNDQGENAESGSSGTLRPVVALAIPLVILSGWISSRAMVEHTVCLGFPAFRRALEALRTATVPGEKIMGTSAPQIGWYTDRETVGLPAESEFLNQLNGVRWVVVTSFERGQPPYASKVASAFKVEDLAAGLGAVYRDGQNEVAVLSGPTIAQRVTFVPASAAPHANLTRPD